MEKSFYHWQEKNLVLELHVQTRASKNAIVGPYGDRLKVTITASPVDGKANKCLIKFLAAYFAVPQNQVKIIKGENSRCKSLLVLDPKKDYPEFKK